MKKLYQLEVNGRVFVTGKVVHLRGVPYRVKSIREITINEGIFGLTDRTYVIRLRNLNRGNEFEITDVHLKQIGL